MKRIIFFLAALSVLFSVFAAEPADQFSRANCFNNESITYNYFDLPEYRAVFSWHFDRNLGRWHYVTENPLAYCTYYTCWYYYTSATRHAGIHGAFPSSEPNPDGALIPFVTTRWQTQGVHKTLVPGVAQYVQVTNATDCNAHLDQFY